MGWESYNLDQFAHNLVLEHFDRGAHNQAYKMRTTASYGLERFWGEQIRLYEKRHGIYYPTAASNYWADTWRSFCRILKRAGVNLPDDLVEPGDREKIEQITKQLWEFNIEQRKVALAVLIQLCDCIVWWSQRYKPSKQENGSEGDEDE